MARALAFFLVWLCCLPLPGHTVPKPAGIFGEHMVLQRDKPIPVWGKADPGEKISVTLGGKKVSGKSRADGKWMLHLPKSKAGGPFLLKVAGQNDTVIYQDVYVGEVWLASGQSNMDFRVYWAVNDEYHVQDGLREVAEANFPLIRSINVPYAPADSPTSELNALWEICSPQTVGNFSAVAYFFGRELYRNLNVPIGLVHASAGGSCMQCWMSRPFLTKEFSEGLRNYDSLVSTFDHNPQGSNPHIDPSIASSICFNSQINPLVPYALRGVIWYQGETVGWGSHTYRALQLDLVKEWRKAWGQGEFPFLITQLANFGPRILDPAALTPWALQREAQMQAVAQGRNMGMAIAVDLGDSVKIHPRNKQEVGLRLSYAARALAYGQNIPHTGPVYLRKRIESDSIRLFFKNFGEKLIAKDDPLQGFSIAGSDGKFFVANAHIGKGNTVVVFSPEVKSPVHVRYAMADNPVVSLYDMAGLPASPFRTDNF